MRRRKLRIVRGCVPRRLLTPLLLLSVKSHAAALLLACKRTRDAPPCYQLFTGGNALTGGSLLLPTFTGENALATLRLAANFLRYHTIRFLKKLYLKQAYPYAITQHIK